MHASLWSKAISMSSTRSVAVASPQLRAVQWLTPWRAAVPNATGRLVPPWSSRKSVRVLCVSPAVHAAPCASLPCAQLLYCVCRRALPHAASISTHRKTRSAYARRCPCSSRSLVCTSMTFLSPMLCRWVGGWVWPSCLLVALNGTPPDDSSGDHAELPPVLQVVCGPTSDEHVGVGLCLCLYTPHTAH